ncbi:hypothetical protein SDC9_170121 [bioreactor metagenome]|uniref:Uncharacterized protein n=1 Tax=bioreactor metagenome TaxID=1076179 RepID=A0A645G778_9ZZZZ
MQVAVDGQYHGRTGNRVFGFGDGGVGVIGIGHGCAVGAAQITLHHLLDAVLADGVVKRITLRF